MSILKVTRLGHPVLRQVAKDISIKDLKSPTMQKFIDDMVETMKEYDGVGLAADQVFTSCCERMGLIGRSRPSTSQRRRQTDS